MFYVYQLIDPRNNKPFYVGKGKNNRMYDHVVIVKRGHSPNGNDKLKNKILKILESKMNIIYKKIFYSDDEKNVFETEEKMIRNIGLKNLCNLTYGGEGNVPSNETREKMRNAQLGKTATKESRKKMSDAKKGKPTWNKGKKGSQVAWNKGLTKETDERVKKYSDTKIGHDVSEEARTKISKTKKQKYKDKIYTVWNKGKKGSQIPWNKGLSMEDERVRNNVEKMVKTRYNK